MATGQVLVTSLVTRETFARRTTWHVALALVGTLPNASLTAGRAWDVAGKMTPGMYAGDRTHLLTGRTGLLAVT